MVAGEGPSRPDEIRVTISAVVANSFQSSEVDDNLRRFGVSANQFYFFVMMCIPSSTALIMSTIAKCAQSTIDPDGQDAGDLTAIKHRAQDIGTLGVGCRAPLLCNACRCFPRLAHGNHLC